MSAEKSYKLYRHKAFECVYCITDENMITLYSTLNINNGKWKKIRGISKIDFLNRFTYIKDLTEAEMFVEML